MDVWDSGRRRTDWARDEFAVICGQGDIAWVEAMITRAVEDTHAGGFEFAGASSGSAYVRETQGKGKLLHLADCRMYENKRLNKRSRYEDQEDQFQYNQRGEE